MKVFVCVCDRDTARERGERGERREERGERRERRDEREGGRGGRAGARGGARARDRNIKGKRLEMLCAS